MWFNINNIYTINNYNNININLNFNTMIGLALLVFTTLIGIMLLMFALIFIGWGKDTKETRYNETLCFIFGTILTLASLHYLL